ncbi:hypothetical protein LJR168_003873 [Pseudoxanthomonas sp. LjRoot168]|uniref:hypothetical protein n=1 Tax=unclassified Pseudoxanthomonas TaxID=2645906 RepID=UPI003ECFBD6E
MYGRVVFRPDQTLMREALPQALRTIAQRKPFEGKGTDESPLVMGWEIAVPKAQASLLDEDAIAWLESNSFSTNRGRLKWSRSDKLSN